MERLVTVLTVEGNPSFTAPEGFSARQIDKIVKVKFGEQSDGRPHNWREDLLENELSAIMAKVTRQRRQEAVAQVQHPRYGEVYKLPDGGWHSPEGGYFGPNTPLASECEKLLIDSA